MEIIISIFGQKWVQIAAMAVGFLGHSLCCI